MMEVAVKKEERKASMPERDEVAVFAPATVANVVCAYDVLGFALDEPGDEIFMKKSQIPGVRITRITGDDGRLPLGTDKNTAGACVQQLLAYLGREDLGIDIELHKKMPIGSGLGSSAASTVGGLFAINELLGRPLTMMELLPFAIKGEELACGHGHADNVAPALLGGFTLIRSYEPLDVVRLPIPTHLHCSVIFPHVDVPTRAAREMIRTKVALKDAAIQWGNIAGLISGLFMEDYDLIGRSMTDVLIEPTRSILIPEFQEMRTIATSLGAISFGISGSGPSVFAFAENQAKAQTITQQIQNHLDAHGVGSNGYVSKINQTGPRII